MDLGAELPGTPAGCARSHHVVFSRAHSRIGSQLSIRTEQPGTNFLGEQTHAIRPSGNQLLDLAPRVSSVMVQSASVPNARAWEFVPLGRTPRAGQFAGQLAGQSERGPPSSSGRDAAERPRMGKRRL